MSHRDIPPLHPATWFTAYSSDLCAVLGLLYTDSLYLLEREGVVGREGVRERGERERERERERARERACAQTEEGGKRGEKEWVVIETRSTSTIPSCGAPKMGAKIP